MVSWSASSAIRSRLSPRPVSDPVRARAASATRASRSARNRAISSSSGAMVAAHEPLAVGVQVSLANGDELAWRGVAAVRQQSVEACLAQAASARRPGPPADRRRRVASGSRRRAAADRAPGRGRGRTTAPGRRSGSRSSRRRTGRLPRRAGRSGRDWRARANRCPGRRSGRGPARWPRRSTRRTCSGGMPASSAVDERLLVVRVDQDDRHAGGRAEDAGRAGGAAGDRVEDRALAGARRSHEEDHDGRIERSGTHADVTAQVVRELAGTGGRGLAPRAQRQAALRE